MLLFLVKYDLFGQDIFLLNPFMPNGISHPCQLDDFIFNFRYVGLYFSLLFKFLRTLL